MRTTPKTAAAPTASVVSRKLNAAGITTSHYERRHRYPGVFVFGRDGGVTVAVDHDVDAIAARRLAAIVSVLTDEGYAVETSPGFHACVTRPAA